MTENGFYLIEDENLMCTCGHTMDKHHIAYALKGDSIFPSECLAHGANEYGGMMLNNFGEYIVHCLKFTPEEITIEIEEKGKKEKMDEETLEQLKKEYEASLINVREIERIVKENKELLKTLDIQLQQANAKLAVAQKTITQKRREYEDALYTFWELYNE